MCLECGREVIVENWQDFENSNYVLKNRNDIDVHKYQNMYYQLLYKNSVAESQQLVINKFNSTQKNLTKSKTY